MIDIIKNKIKNCDDVSVLSLVCIIGLLVSVISIIIDLIKGYYSYIGAVRSVIFLAPLVTLFIYIKLQYKTKQAKLYIVSIVLQFITVLISVVPDIEYIGVMSIVFVLVPLSLSAFILFFIHKKADKKSYIIIVSILYALSLIFLSRIYIVELQTFSTIVFSAVTIYINLKVIQVKKSKIELMEEILKELKSGYDKGLISEEFYNNKKKEILNKL